jgi:CRP-like cAMP-binding protein
LSILEPRDATLLAPNLEPIDLPRRFELEGIRKPISHIYFPEDGIVSVVAMGAREQNIEVGIIGRDGVSGLAVIMGTDRSVNTTFMQIPGCGVRIESDKLRAAMQQSETLRSVLLAFAQAFAAQSSHTALANGRATLDERLARWLLMANDRLDGSQVPLTHELLSIMLGVQRPGVSLATQDLEAAGYISTQRGIITIENRDGLKKIAGGFYGVPEAEHGRLTGWRPLHDRN